MISFSVVLVAFTTEMEQEEDRLSNLPKIILHHILSRLPEKDAARTSVLSKAWTYTWLTFPILYFSDNKFIGWLPQSMDDVKRKRRKFIDYVTRTLSRNLKGLYLLSLKGNTITDKWFLELFLKFAFLERLKFVKCTMSETINISSVQLKVLELSHCHNMKEVNIDAPNLLSCEYIINGDLKPNISFVKSSSKLKVDVQINTGYLDLGNLKEFLQNIKPGNVLTSLSLFIFELTEDEFNPTVFQVSSPPPSIKHLHLHSFPKNVTLYSSLLSILPSSCCFATISMRMHPCFCSREFIEFFYETLMRRKDDDCFCSSNDTKCWWHGLKDLKVTRSMKIDENVDFKTLLESSPTFSASDISFILEF
uniref:Cyclin-like F-box n=2 Tax=Medicago truncatula TaxID=3880 RepID=A2Q6A7_MEDTR|nr:Cyclin-like F-box [Medicago truncatula]